MSDIQTIHRLLKDVDAKLNRILRALPQAQIKKKAVKKTTPAKKAT